VNGFEGGQMPIYRRLPKRGFTNIFRKKYGVLNVGRLQAAIESGRVDAGQPITSAALVSAGVVTDAKDGVRLLGKGALTAKIEIHVAGASKAAVEAVEKAGGSVVLPAGAAVES